MKVQPKTSYLGLKSTWQLRRPFCAYIDVTVPATNIFPNKVIIFTVLTLQKSFLLATETDYREP